MLSDNEIKVVSSEIDDILVTLALKHKLSMLSLSAVVVARMLLANQECESEYDFKVLLKSIAGKDYEQSFTTYAQH